MKVSEFLKLVRQQKERRKARLIQKEKDKKSTAFTPAPDTTKWTSSDAEEPGFSSNLGGHGT